MKKHPYGTVNPISLAVVADDVLDEFFEIANRLKIKAFLMYGLCLGFVRDGEYIEGDNDLDVGVICNKKGKRRLMATLEKHNFTQGRSFRKKNTHFHKNKILVDVHFRESKGIFYSKLESVYYGDKEYPVPSPIKEYLATCYPNWKRKENQTCRKAI